MVKDGSRLITVLLNPRSSVAIQKKIKKREIKKNRAITTKTTANTSFEDSISEAELKVIGCHWIKEGDRCFAASGMQPGT